MSVKVMSYVWDIPSFKGSDKLVMLCLADHSDDQGLCWPSIDTISRKSGVSVTTVKTTLTKLEKARWIAKKNRFKTAETGRLVRASNQYQLNVFQLKKEADEQANFEQTKFDHSKFDQSKYDEGVSQFDEGGRSKSGYKPSLDPSIEPSSKDLVPSELETENTEPVLFEIPLKGKTKVHGVTKSQLDELSELYPAVDVCQQIRNMIGWCKANPTRQKTSSGVAKFIHSWLCKEQDKGYSAAKPIPTPTDDKRKQMSGKIRDLEIQIDSQGIALNDFKNRKGPVSAQAAEACQRKINQLLSQRESLIAELRGLDGK